MNNSSENQRPKVGVGVCVLNQGKVLLGKRKGSHCSGEWSFAGGHLEFGESIENCAIRELAEETNLKVISQKIGPWTNDIIEETKHYLTMFVIVDQFEGELKLLEPHKCEGWEWFTWDNLPSPLFLPVRSFIQKIGLEKLKNLPNYN